MLAVQALRSLEDKVCVFSLGAPFIDLPILMLSKYSHMEEEYSLGAYILVVSSLNVLIRLLTLGLSMRSPV